MDTTKRAPGPVLSCPGPVQRRQEALMLDIPLPGMLGPFDRLNVHAEYWHRSGWQVTLRHKHDREPYNCTHVVTLEGLSLEELVQAVEDFLTTGADRFDWDAEGDRCSPHSRG